MKIVFILFGESLEDEEEFYLKSRQPFQPQKYFIWWWMTFPLTSSLSLLSAILSPK